MNLPYSTINQAILSGRDIDEKNLPKNANFYTYLLNNKVAFYYASELSARTTPTEKTIIQKGRAFQARYLKSLQLIQKICKEQGYEYLLYKTHRYIPEIVDGDIDLMVRRSDFTGFMESLAKEGFMVEEDEPGKGKCEHPDYCVIEPHINVSWRGGDYVQESFIWANPRQATIGNKTFPTVSYEVELLALVAKILFEPAYLDLYSLKSMQYFYDHSVDERNMLRHAVRPDLIRKILEFCKDTAQKPGDKMPVFLPNLTFMPLWTKNFLETKDTRIYLLHSLYFFYWKYRYLYINKLPFTHHHDW